MVESNKKIKFINIESSPSYVFDNISVSDRHILYIHNSENIPKIVLIDKNLIHSDPSIENLTSYVSKLNSEETFEMNRAKFIKMNNILYIAVCLYGGFKLWANDGTRLIFQIPNKIKNSEKPYAFTSVIHFNYSNYDCMIASDNYGCTYLINGSGLNWRSKLLYNYENNVTTALAHYNENIYIAYETGEIHSIKIKNESSIEILVKWDNPYALPCLTLAVINQPKPRLAAGYINGEIRLYQIGDKNELVFSISAHLRLITSITSSEDYLVSTGDDCFVNIWKCGDKIELIKNIDINDRMHVGVEIYKEDLYVTSYDSGFAFIEKFII